MVHQSCGGCPVSGSGGGDRGEWVTCIINQSLAVVGVGAGIEASIFSCQSNGCHLGIFGEEG